MPVKKKEAPREKLLVVWQAKGKKRDPKSSFHRQRRRPGEKKERLGED